MHGSSSPPLPWHLPLNTWWTKYRGRSAGGSKEKSLTALLLAGRMLFTEQVGRAFLFLTATACVVCLFIHFISLASSIGGKREILWEKEAEKKLYCWQCIGSNPWHLEGILKPSKTTAVADLYELLGVNK